MIFVKSLKFPAELGKSYRTALAEGIELAPDSEKSLYELHIKSLKKLEVLFSSMAPIDEIASQLRTERRAFGWSFLSGDYGARVEHTFHVFASEVERQIINLKGKEWYYSIG